MVTSGVFTRTTIIDMLPGSGTKPPPNSPEKPKPAPNRMPEIVFLAPKPPKPPPNSPRPPRPIKLDYDLSDMVLFPDGGTKSPPNTPEKPKPRPGPRLDYHLPDMVLLPGSGIKPPPNTPEKPQPAPN